MQPLNYSSQNGDFKVSIDPTYFMQISHRNLMTSELTTSQVPYAISEAVETYTTFTTFNTRPSAIPLRPLTIS